MKTTRVSPVAAPIAVEGLTKRYGALQAVDDLSFAVRAGAVTGFLGPNGAGKTTALKMIVGLARPTAGRALVNGSPVASAAADAHMLGVCIEPCGAHPGRSARNHLRSLAALAALPRSRVDEVLALVGLEQAAGRRVGTYSTGMRQRLGLAAALLGDPQILVLDEPLNGLDPQGIVEVAAYRFALEAMTNSARHADARTCVVRIALNGDIELDVVDDGGGLPADYRAGVGISSMRERAEELRRDVRGRISEPKRNESSCPTPLASS